MLTPVSFRKGRNPQPRLSAPSIPGRHSERFWREDENEVLRQHYELSGPAACVARLPGRTTHAVYVQARKLDLLFRGVKPKTPPVGPAFDDAIKERWPTLSGRGAVGALADELGIARHVLSQRALKLGLTLPHRKEPPWTAAEDELLRSAPVNNPEMASRFFAAHGFRRSPSAIVVRCKRQGVSRRRRDVFTATGAARVLGVDNKTMATWCAEGLLVATRRGTQRLSQQGGDMWTIQPDDLRRFVVEQLDRLDIRKVDKHAFVALLTTAPEKPDA